MPYPTDASAPADVRDRFKGHCLYIWRTTWNDTYARHRNEGRAFATAETAAKACMKAGAMDLPNKSLKFTAPDVIEGPGIPFGGPFAGKDLDGEYFAPDTDFCMEWFGESGRPLLYHHGINEHVKTAVVGRQTGYKVTDDGIWVTAELDKASRYRKIVGDLIEQGALGFSSGSMPHLITKDSKSGKLTRWPWVEISLTPEPANPDAAVYAVKATDALEHLAAVDIDIPAPLSAALKALDEWAETRDTEGLPDGLSYAKHFDRVLVEAKALVERTQDIAAMRAKVGRTLSTINRDRLASLRDQAAAVVSDLEDLLIATDPERDKRASLAALAEFELLTARLNGVAI